MADFEKRYAEIDDECHSIGMQWNISQVLPQGLDWVKLTAWDAARKSAKEVAKKTSKIEAVRRKNSNSLKDKFFKAVDSLYCDVDVNSKVAQAAAKKEAVEVFDFLVESYNQSEIIREQQQQEKKRLTNMPDDLKAIEKQVHQGLKKRKTVAKPPIFD